MSNSSRVTATENSVSSANEWKQRTSRSGSAVSSDDESSDQRGNGTCSSDDDSYGYCNSKSRYDYERGDSVVRDAVVASTALMGENILDSPGQRTQSRLFQLRDRSALGTPSNRRPDHGTLTAPDLNNSNNGSSENANAISVGIMAQGLAWARRQRDRRQRQYLQLQAEKQLRKIQQAQQEEKGDTNDAGGSLLDNPIFQNLALARKSSREDESIDEDCDAKPSIDVSDKISKSGDGYSVELPVEPDRDVEDASWIPPVRVEDESSDLSTCPFILSPSEMQQIAVNVLPKGISYSKWKRCYSLARDGDSFENCLRNVENEKQTLLVVRTTRNQVLGGFADEAWESHVHGGACYYGGPAACLFKVIPAVDDTQKSKVQYFRWTGANRYVQLCDVSHKRLAFGGGGDDGAFGLCVEQDFQVGSTGSCATFNNEPLCDQENFDIVDVEIYGYLLGQF